jgi:hypothetical protein
VGGTHWRVGPAGGVGLTGSRLIGHHGKRVNRNSKAVVALVLAIGITLLFALPAYNIMPTALRAWRAAKLLALAIATLVLILLVTPAIHTLPSARLPGSLHDPSGILDMTSAMRC